MGRKSDNGVESMSGGRLRKEPLKVLGRSMKYLDVLSSMDPEYLYTASSIGQYARDAGFIEESLDPDEKRLHQQRIRVTMGRLSKNHFFPETGDGLVTIKSMMTIQAWFGWRWQDAARIRSGPPQPRKEEPGSRKGRTLFNELTRMMTAVQQRLGESSGPDLYREMFLKEIASLGLKIAEQEALLIKENDFSAFLKPDLVLEDYLAIFIRMNQKQDPHSSRLLQSYLNLTPTRAVTLVDFSLQAPQQWSCDYLDSQVACQTRYGQEPQTTTQSSERNV